MRQILTTSAYVETTRGAHYAAQLCKHFAHKVETSFHDGIGECRFSCGKARLVPGDAGLAIDIEAPSRDELAETQDVIERHLVRFAFRDDLQTIDWSEATPLDPATDCR